MMQLKKMAGVVGLLMLSLLTGSALAQTNAAAVKTIGYQTALAGEFRSLGAPTAGRVEITKNGKNYLLKISGLNTQPAPDLKVWLYKGDLAGASLNVQVPEKYLTLGTVKRFDGDFTFTIVGTDISNYSSVVLWCDQVKTAFGVAVLNEAN
ncbi:DM13 domain-containing protein [Deinococcus sp.]|uniref:DM13 domain-containing protein n=1 Tax=Deinococcus sp. TaxID=47478 RepID=UPI003B58E50C